MKATIENTINTFSVEGISGAVPLTALVESWHYDDEAQHLRLELRVAMASLHDAVCEALLACEGVKTVELVTAISARQSHNNQRLHNVKNIVVIASGKGGVGKSTTTVNLAVAMAKEGARVGILDADIYGPSIPHMLGIPAGQRPEIKDDKYFQPIERYGVQALSMGMLVTETTPVVWRGPKASGALQQLMRQTLWDDLDYLFVDMPPGTGDIQLTLAQQFPLTASIIVTTPQTIALLDAKKGLEMFRKIKVEPLGIIENMSTHVCSQCQHEDAIFGEGGGERLAAEYETTLLGSLPLLADIGLALDKGEPSVAQNSETVVSQRYLRIARQISFLIALKPKAAPPPLRVQSL